MAINLTDLSCRQKNTLLTGFFDMDKSLNLYDIGCVAQAWDVMRRTCGLGMDIHAFFRANSLYQKDLLFAQSALLDESLQWLDWYGYITRLVNRNPSLLFFGGESDGPA